MATCDVCGRPKAGCGGGPVCRCLGYAAQRARADRLAGALRAMLEWPKGTPVVVIDAARRALGEEPGR